MFRYSRVFLFCMLRHTSTHQFLSVSACEKVLISRCSCILPKYCLCLIWISDTS
jgi:hypothetical protein